MCQHIEAKGCEPHRIADVVLLAEPPEGPLQAFYLFEGAAQPSREAVFQLLEYTARLGRWLEKQSTSFELIPVLVVIAPGNVDTQVRIGSNARTYLSFDCEVCRLSEMDAQAMVAAGDEVALANAMNMRCGPERRVQLCAEAIVRLYKLLPPEQFQKYWEYLVSCARLNEEQRVELERLLRESPMQVETLITDWVKKGRAEGRAGAMRELLLGLLSARKLKPTQAQLRKVRTSQDPVQLKRWFDAAVSARSARDVFAGD